MPEHRTPRAEPASDATLWLGDGEQLQHVLTNERTGVDHSEATSAIRPAADRQAIAGVTDHRVVFVVGGPSAYDGDFVRSLWHSEIVEMRVETESLTTRWEFETTAGRCWSFTARETNTSEVAAFLAAARADRSGPHPVVRPLVEHCTILSVHLEREDWAAFDRHRATAWEALDRAREDCPDSPAGVPNAVERLSRELHRLARDRQLRAGRAALSAAEERLDAGALAAGYRRARTGADRFERARTLSERDDIDGEAAVSGLVEADELAENALGRLLATAKMHRAEAAEQSDVEQRVSTLETALDRYNTAATLVTDDSVSEAVRTRARTEAQQAIQALIDARLDAASAHGVTGNRELADGNEADAKRAYLAALEDLDRARELARSFPAGDIDSIRTRREALTAQMASLSD